MKIHVELVGYLSESGLADTLGRGELEVTDGMRLEELMNLLEPRDRIPVLTTVNGKRASPSLILKDDDVLRLIPLVSGG
jgi:sulfur carrier protein ThiS